MKGSLDRVLRGGAGSENAPRDIDMGFCAGQRRIEFRAIERDDIRKVGWRSRIDASMRLTFSLWATNRDPDMLRIVIASSGSRRRYDPGKHERFDVEVVPW